MITKPTLLIDESKCRNNINDMLLKAKNHKVNFRPHFKTHQSALVGLWFKEAGIKKITVSSFEMAEYFASQFDDITVAFPVNVLEIETINKLSEKIQLNVLVESTFTVDFLKNKAKNKLGVFIKIDVGYNRTGIDFGSTSEINRILEIINNSENLNFIGFLTHAGHSYNCRSSKAVLDIFQECQKIMATLKSIYIKDYPNLIVSVGDTPGCSLSDNFSGIDEIRPGNFVFYDLDQYQIGSCNVSQIAVAMACPIVSIHNKRNEIVIYGGAVHFSKDQLNDEVHGVIYGKVVEQTKNGWGNIIPNMYLKSLSQEHGTVSVSKSEIKNYTVGDILYILPVHSCLTASATKNHKVI